MEPEDYGAAMEKAESILGEGAPLTRKDTRAYSKAIRSVFARIERLRSKGFSFVQICAACEKSGILPNDANPYCFRQAFRRERARLLAEGELAKQIADGSGTAGKTAMPSPKAGTPDGEAAEKEWIRKQLSTAVDTGTGKIIKNPDGSFDYN
jgi:DNA-binding transcriptional MerR regulator